MDIDDGYILWTGIWKGECTTLYYLHDLASIFSALGNSKGVLAFP
jgi:hypothetical protein